MNGLSPNAAARVQDAARALLRYCINEGWAGHDPYDALNARAVAALPVLRRRIPAVALTQLLKRSPVNLRPLLGVPKTQNPKAIGLFLSALLHSSAMAGANAERLIRELAETLLALRSPGTDYWCWGYSFPWQGRNVVVPRWTPNLVCTQFAAMSLLDLFESTHDTRYLEIAASAADFILETLYWTGNDGEAGFSYPLPTVRNQVHNANFLGAALLCRLLRHTGREQYREAALKVARSSAARQMPDGSWMYGESPTQQWIDNFHTGFNLCALRSIAESTGSDEFDVCVQRGLDFYRTHFFRDDGAPRYFHNRTYPIDIHCVAQSIITLVNLRDLHPDNLRLAEKVFDWMMEHMHDRRGFFYYRVLRSATIRVSYMRWSQAWMLLALAHLTRAAEPKSAPQPSQSTAQLC